MSWPASKTGWTDERLARLKKLWDDGYSAQQIAQDLGGCTRNAVVGVVHRRGWSRPEPKASRIRDRLPRVGGAAALARAKAAVPVEHRPRAIQTRGPVIAVSRLAPLPPARPAPAVADASLAKPWTERAFGECAFPIAGEGADTVSCCQPVTPIVIREVGGKPTGGRYCRAHERVMHVPGTHARDLIRSARRYA